jgi:hypothetical protein
MPQEQKAEAGGADKRPEAPSLVNLMRCDFAHILIVLFCAIPMWL